MNMTGLTLLFCGDFAPVRRFEPLTIKKGKNIFGDLQGDIASADISFLNLEAPLTEKGKKIDKAGPCLKAAPECVDALSDAGFDVVGLANNHIMDYGDTGLLETMKLVEDAGMSSCGVGRSLAEAQRPLILSRKGVSVAIIAISEHEYSIAKRDFPGAAPLDVVDNLRQLERARELADIVIITIHGGNEFFPHPRPGLKKLCRFFIENGADAVVCHHSHMPGSYENYRGCPIIYSLGNLVFDHAKPPVGWDEGYVLRLSFCSKSKRLLAQKIIPYKQGVDEGGVRKLYGEEKAVFMRRIESLRVITSDDQSLQKEWDKFCDSKEIANILGLFLPFQLRGINKVSKFIPIYKLYYLKPLLYRRLNFIRCESHLELLRSILERK
jgi:Bacterial capsule synthesis protein PGA_cap